MDYRRYIRTQKRIERIEIHSDKQVDIYFNFKPLQDLNEDLNSFCVAKKEYERKVG